MFYDSISQKKLILCSFLAHRNTHPFQTGIGFFQTRTAKRGARPTIQRLHPAVRSNVNAFPTRRVAVVSTRGNRAVHSFATALETHLSRHGEAASTPDIAVYKAEHGAIPAADAFETQLGFLRAAELAISAGNRIIVMPEIACHEIAAALLPALLVPVVDISTAVLDSLRASGNRVRRVRLISVTPPANFLALATRFADAGIELGLTRLDHAEPQRLVIAAQQAGHAGIERLWLADELWHLGGCLPATAPLLVDPVEVCARPVLDTHTHDPFKLGVVGGVGPAATVAFLDHVVQATPAQRDQEHIRIVVEQNPQIPDRTAHLLRNGVDPTLALLSTCERLQHAGAAAIAIPCNTAHAFVKRIESSLSVPVVHMLRETIDFIVRHLPEARTVGLLATDGTIESCLYHDEARAAGIELLVPSAPHQQAVMTAIYGPRGVKAGHRDAAQRKVVEHAIAHLASRGARAVILGCTELPLLIAQDLRYASNGLTVAVIDPSRILASRCVELSTRSSFASRTTAALRTGAGSGWVA